MFNFNFTWVWSLGLSSNLLPDNSNSQLYLLAVQHVNLKEKADLVILEMNEIQFNVSISNEFICFKILHFYWEKIIFYK